MARYRKRRKPRGPNPQQERSMARVLERFQSGQVAQECAYATFPPANVPSAKWTLSNRWMAYITTGGSLDARGYRQWEEAGRYVKAGEKAGGHIWAPRIITEKDPDTGEKRRKCVGFYLVAVFAVEQTDGDPLDYEHPEVLDRIPLVDVARAWDIDVKAQSNPMGGSSLGFYRVDGTQIQVHTGNAHVFLHELSHAAHARILKDRGEKMTGGQDPWQEIIAEFSAEVLYSVCCPDGPDMSGTAYSYIEGYAGSKGIGVADACAKCLREASKVVELILTTAEEIGALPQPQQIHA